MISRSSSALLIYSILLASILLPAYGDDGSAGEENVNQNESASEESLNQTENATAERKLVKRWLCCGFYGYYPAGYYSGYYSGYYGNYGGYYGGAPVAIAVEHSPSVQVVSRPVYYRTVVHRTVPIYMAPTTYYYSPTFAYSPYLMS